MRVSVSLRPDPHLFFPVVLISATLVDVMCYLVEVLICTSLMANNIEHLFM